MLPRARGPRRAGPRAESACIAQARQLAVSENAGLLFHPSGSVVQARARPALRRPPAGRRTHQHALRAGQGACLGSVSRGALDSARAAGRGGGGGVGGWGGAPRARGCAPRWTRQHDRSARLHRAPHTPTRRNTPGVS